MNSAVDYPALLLGTAVAGAITGLLAIADRGGNRRRRWVVAGGLALVLLAIGLVDLLRETPRETHVASVIFGALLPVAGGLGAIHASRRVRPWLRWTIVLLVTFILLFGGLLLGAAILPRILRG